MLNKIAELKPYSISKLDEFMWVAEYLDGTLLPQYDFKTLRQNSFSAMNKSQLLRAGMVGHGYHMWYEVANGHFYFAKRDISFIYRVKGVDYILTDNITYNDAIIFQEACSTFNNARINNDVFAYDFGYKSIFNNKGINFSFKPLFRIALDEPVHMNIRIVADQDLQGQLVIRVNGLKEHAYEAPLQANVGGELSWIVK